MSDLISRLNAALEGRYKIEHELGEGGMATVFLAEDVRHDRRVALKVLKADLAAVVGGERFLAEIRTTANLQHPHILPLFDSGEADGLVFYVMPYVAGESLRERLERQRQLPVDEAIDITLKVLSALQYAHDQGVVHRDVKPANILMSESGEPLVADFGIALALSQAGGGRFTETGLSLGTPHYMSPEQAMGDREIDPRSDIYAAGCVLYEMLAGAPPFTAATAQAVLAKVLTEDAPDVSSARKSVPPHVAHAVQRSLERLPADRFSSAADFARALREVGLTPRKSGRAAAETALPTVRPLALGGWVIAALLLTWVFVGPRPEGLAPAVQVSFSVVSADGAPVRSYDPIQLSPDGSLLTFVALDGGQSKLQLRRLNEAGTQWIEGTEGARDPFFSADGSRIAFFSEAGLRSVDIESTNLEPLAGPERLGTFQQSGVWLANGWILYTHEDSPHLWALSPGGEQPQVLFDQTMLEGTGRFRIAVPIAITESRALLNVIHEDDTRTPVIADTEDSTIIRLDAAGIPAGYWSGVLALLGAQLSLVELDPASGRLGQDRVALGPGFQRRFVDPIPVAREDLQIRLHPSLLVTLEEEALDDLGVARATRTGEFSDLEVPRGSWLYPRLSPDESRLLLAGVEGDTESVRGTRPQSVLDLRTGTRTPLADGGEHAWGPQGLFVYFSGFAGTSNGIARQRADGSSAPDVVVDSLPSPPWVTSVSQDGRTLLYYSDNIRALDLETGETRVLIDDLGVERNAEFSPDGAFVAYSSTGSGREQVYVKPYPSLDQRWTVSIDGGEMPIWSRDGSELYFVSGDRLMTTTGIVGGAFQPGRPQELFRGGFLRQPNGDQSYDVASDGRFVMIRGSASAKIAVTTGWLETALEEVGADFARWRRDRQR